MCRARQRGDEAAQAAGMHLAWMSDERSDLSKSGFSVEVISSLEEFDPEKYGLLGWKR